MDVGFLTALFLGFIHVDHANAYETMLPVWMQPEETPGLDSDLTAKQQKVLSRIDPGVQGSETAVGSAVIGFKEQLIRVGSKPLKGLKVLGPAQWSKLDNIRIVNETVFNYYGTQVVETEKGLQPATQYVYTADYTIQERPRRMALFIIDMEKEYIPFVGYMIPQIKPLLDVFRKRGLPVFWSNWLRRTSDDLFGGLDRFYGPTGIQDQMNPMYNADANGGQTVPDLAPTKKEEEMGRVIKSTHLGKFFEMDPKTGKSLLAEKFRKMGVDTVVLVGSWTEDCVLSTVISAVDHYNLDVVLVDQAVGSATPFHFPSMALMRASYAKIVSNQEIVESISNEPSERLWESRAGLPDLEDLDTFSSIAEEGSPADLHPWKGHSGTEAMATVPESSLLSSGAPVVTALFAGIVIGAFSHKYVIASNQIRAHQYKSPLLE